MQSPIWTPAALSSEAAPFRGSGWRLVEAQHRVSTLKLVDDLDEQAVLEDLIEATKPSLPPDCRRLDYLFATPFRYGAPYPHGSRFRRAGWTAGVYYAAESARTAVAELAFHRLLFFADSPETPWPREASEYTAFSASLATGHELDLTRAPFDRDQSAWTHPTEYGACQDFADGARAAGADLIRYWSVRDPDKGANLAVLSCKVFAKRKPLERRVWRIRLGPTGVQALCEYPEDRIGFDTDAFSAADPRIAGLRWRR